MKLWIKIAMVLGMTLGILIPLSMVRGVIHERQAYRAQLVDEVARSYAGPQTVTGPVLVVPYVETVVSEETDRHNIVRKVQREQTGYWTYFPTRLELSGPVNPALRERGVHKVRVYSWDAQAAASFDVTVPDDAKPEAMRRIGKPWLSVGISDVRGLSTTPRLLIDGRPQPVIEGLGNRDGGGIHVRLAAPAPGQRIAFATRMDFTLRGTEQLALVPLGKNNTFSLTSTWPHPSFGGAFLTSSHDISADGFRADWRIASVATSAQRQYLATPAQGEGGAIDAVSVGLVDPVNVYSQADRATKYGVLFVLLTFVGFFMFELIKQLPIHPIQYGLVGLALTIFFLLVVSLSEHLEFGWSYLCAALACIGLITFYLTAVLRSTLRAIGFAAMLSTLYAALYGLLISEDNALVMGAGLLFLILAAIMVVTRKVDWYQLSASKPTDETLRERLEPQG